MYMYSLWGFLSQGTSLPLALPTARRLSSQSAGPGVSARIAAAHKWAAAR